MLASFQMVGIWPDSNDFLKISVSGLDKVSLQFRSMLVFTLSHPGDLFGSRLTSNFLISSSLISDEEKLS